jgi:hypothetical protein
MSLTKLPSGRLRARVWHQGRDVPVAPVFGLPKGTSWRTTGEAKAAREKARAILKGNTPGDTTVRQWWERWTSEPLFARPKESTSTTASDEGVRGPLRNGATPPGRKLHCGRMARWRSAKQYGPGARGDVQRCDERQGRPTDRPEPVRSARAPYDEGQQGAAAPGPRADGGHDRDRSRDHPSVVRCLPRGSGA